MRTGGVAAPGHAHHWGGSHAPHASDSSAWGWYRAAYPVYAAQFTVGDVSLKTCRHSDRFQMRARVTDQNPYQLLGTCWTVE